LHSVKVFVVMYVKIRTHKSTIMSDLETQLAQQAPTSTSDTSMLFELPPLTVDGIPTQLDKMTQVTCRLVLIVIVIIIMAIIM